MSISNCAHHSVRTGLYPTAKGLPVILGQEASGTIAAVQGSNSYDFKEGDRVVWMQQGGYAEYTAVAAERIIKIPDGVSDEDAVGGFLMGMTALSLVREAYPVKKGDWVLLHAAAGGVGLLMCQLLKAIGARTIATAGGPEKCTLAKENGAEFLIDYKAPSGPTWQEQVKEITKGVGVDVVYDSVGADTWEGSLAAIRRKGTVVYYGAASGPVPPFSIQKLAVNNATLLRPTLMNYIFTREEYTHYSGELFKLLKSGELKVRYHKTYPLADVVEAHKDLEGRKTSGKLLLKL
jgi:NADPH:quinone reductase